MFRLLFACSALLLCSKVLPVARATVLTCTPSAMPAVVHGEGITERTGDIVFACSGGAPNATITANLFIFLNASITNRLVSQTSGAFTGLALTADNGSGPQAITVPPTSIGNGALVFNGATFTLSSSGSVTLQLSGLRGAANELNFAANSTLQVLIGLNPNNVFALSSNQLTVGIPEHGLYAGFSSTLVCSQKGSPLPPDITSFANFFAAGSTFSSTRLTEGFGDSFGPLAAAQNLNADSGTRLIVQYSGFPQGARLFVPTVVAGSDATQPTAGGDLGFSASGGKYTPGGNPSLLLSFVQNANANGAGGTPLYTPGAPGSGTVSFDSMSEVILTNGTGVAVYEVMDANPSIQESAQFPTFLALAPFSGAADSNVRKCLARASFHDPNCNRERSHSALPTDRDSGRLHGPRRLQCQIFSAFGRTGIVAQLHRADRQSDADAIRYHPEPNWGSLAMDCVPRIRERQRLAEDIADVRAKRFGHPRGRNSGHACGGHLQRNVDHRRRTTGRIAQRANYAGDHGTPASSDSASHRAKQP